MSIEPEIDFHIGGCGGAYLLAEPGDLIVDVEKRDRNTGDEPTDLRAILVGPDREVLQDVTIPDDGQPEGIGLGPSRKARLQARAERKGIYALNITVSNDRYGDKVVWGFATNCPRYLIEASRGHRDAQHQEPIVLADPARPRDICFRPRAESFSIEASDLHDGPGPLSVYDAADACVGTLEIDASGCASIAFPVDESRSDAPWRLHLPSSQGVVHIDGVTRWEGGGFCRDSALWTPHRDSWFALHPYRWILTPYKRTLYAAPGSRAEAAFRVTHDHAAPQTIRLDLDTEGASGWPVELSAREVHLAPGEVTSVTVSCAVPETAEPGGEALVCHLRATPEAHPDVSTCSVLNVRPGVAPATRALAPPIVLTPYRHENAQFGYRPDYPLTNQVYFDLKNRPFVRTETGISAWRDGGWFTSDLQEAEKSHDPRLTGRFYRTSSTKIAFDDRNDLYFTAAAAPDGALLCSADSGRSFTARLIEGGGERPPTLDIEQSSGQNDPEGPPPILRCIQTAADENLRWRKINDMDLFLPVRDGDGLELGDPIRIADKCLGLSSHSGPPSSLASRGSRVHMAWGEATEPDADVPGVPAYVATYDRATGTLGDPVLVGYGPPANDVHNTPSITIDGQGYLHVVVGTHGSPFVYARSLEPNNAYAGWTSPEPTCADARQTYIGLVCGPDDTLHLAFRYWLGGTERFPVGHFGTLAYQRKRPGEPWEAPRVLVEPPFTEYSIYYHRLTIDRTGRLFLSYDYWSTYWFYRNDHVGRRRTLLTSPDGGDTWKLAETSDLVPA
jgi:hypothetical protein